ncbi:MAG: S9 family peptidase [Candidatus Eremiobacteraeota bacterium]|nr:S9 family peptidase [Candidatus Eremiobacteraeota bacterium]
MRLLLCTLVFLSACTLAASARPVLSAADVARLVDLDEPAISPDGRMVALVEVTQDLARARYVNSLLLVRTADGRARPLVRGHDVAVPRWSPDGRALAYVARTGSAATRQLFVRRNGATSQLTHARGDVVDFAWSPNGRQIAYVAADPPSGGTYFFAGDNDYTAAALTPADHLWIVSSSGGAERRLTRGTWTIAPTDPGGIFSPQIAWAHDGRHVTLTRVENTFSGDSERSTLWSVDTATGALRKLTSHPELELTPAYSPDGTALTYWYPLNGDFNSENTLRLIAGAKDTDVAARLDRNIAGALWFPDGRHLLICAADHTEMTAWTVDRDGTTLPLNLGDLHMVCDPYSSSTFDAGIDADIALDGSIAFVATSSTRARELYFLPRGATAPRRLTHVNDFVADFAIGRMEELDWTGPDGFQENGVVTYPPAIPGSARAKAPIVLLIHGGPGLSSTRDFAWEQWPLAQMIASRGFVVLQPNYRGSDNIGNAYMIAIVHNTVAGPSADILAGLAELERRPGVDSSRVAVSGWSYGGELTSWLIGHYHDWRAAVSGAAVNSEFDEYNLSTSNVQDRYPLGTSPYTDDGQRIYRENSPITYYAAITTPTLIWGTTLDPVVPITQSYALYHALHDRGIPVRFAVFPAATHGPGDPRQAVELTRLWLDWLDRYLR